MAQVDITESLRFNRIDAAARQGIARVWPILEPELPRFLKGFYEHVTQWPELKNLFANDASMQRASKAQQSHWQRLFSGKFDDDYAASVNRIAQVHNQIGLAPEPYIAAYLMILQELHAHVIGHFMHAFRSSESRRQIEEAVRAIDRAVLFDIQFVVATYLKEGQKGFAERLNELADQFNETIGSFTDQVSQAAQSLHVNAASLQSATERTAEEATQAAAGAEEASTNLQTVASATEEMNASIAEITRQVSHAMETANEAVATVQSTEEAARGLNEASAKIGQVVNLIQTIAAQTNLLALNATIEAARAGEAGRGFAVVASEVKSLSSQTARATGDINRQVTDIQTVAGEVAQSIGGITATVGRIREAATAISSAVEEQSAVTKEIGRTIIEAATGSSHVSGSVQEVKSVSVAAQQSAGLVAQAATTLTEQANGLREIAAEFIQKIRTADRRTAERKRVATPVRLHFATATVEGTMRDLSDNGAACWVDGKTLPLSDEVRISAGGLAVEAKVVNRSANSVNLQFIDGAAGSRFVVGFKQQKRAA